MDEDEQNTDDKTTNGKPLKKTRKALVTFAEGLHYNQKAICTSISNLKLSFLGRTPDKH